MPRLWSTAWSLGLTSSSQATSTRKLYLQHLDSFYRYCDERFGADAFDEGMSTRDAEGVMLMVESFYLTTTSDPAYNTTDVQRWGVVRAFVQSLAKRLAPSYQKEAPRLCRGGSRSLTFQEVVHRRDFQS